MKTSIVHISPQPAGREAERKSAGLSTTDEAVWESFGPLRDGIDMTTIIPEEDGFDGHREQLESARGVVFTGGSASLLDSDYMALAAVREMFRVAEGFLRAGKPVLAICLGHQVINEIAGGSLEKAKEGGEFGRFQVELTNEGISDPVFEGVPDTHPIFQGHSDTIREPSSDAVVLANSGRCPFQALRYPDAPEVITLQSHPEWPPTEGRKIIIHHDPDFQEEAAHDPTQDELARVVGYRIIRNWLKGILGG